MGSAVVSFAGVRGSAGAAVAAPSVQCSDAHGLFRMDNYSPENRKVGASTTPLATRPTSTPVRGDALPEYRLTYDLWIVSSPI